MKDKIPFIDYERLSHDMGEFFRSYKQDFRLDLARGPDMTATQVYALQENQRRLDANRYARAESFEMYCIQDRCTSLIDRMPRRWMPLVWQFDLDAVRLWYIQQLSFEQARDHLFSHQNQVQHYRTSVPQLGRHLFERKKKHARKI